MPADEEPGVLGREIRPTESHFSLKTSSRASLSSVAATPTPCYSSSSSSVSSEIAGSLSSAELHSPTCSSDPVVCVAAPTCTSTNTLEVRLVPQTTAPHRLPPVASPSLFPQRSPPSDRSVSSSDRNHGLSPASQRRTSPDATPTVTISRHVPVAASVGWLRGSPTPSLASSVSLSSGQSSASPPVGGASVVASICTSVPPSSSLVSTVSLSIPTVSLSPYLSRGHSPTTTRIVRSTSAAASYQQPSPASRRSSPGLRIPETTSTPDHLLSSSLRLSGGGEQRGPRLHNLALTHLASSDAVPPCLHSPPPSYEQLCNPNALPTYQEATQSSSSKRRGEQRTVFTLPSNTDPITADPLLQEGDRSLRGGVLASLAAELSDSEGGYSTILDAIPHEYPRDPCATVPVRFLRSCSLRRLRPPKIRTPCLTSVCNQALVRKELNRRWPFIAGAREDDRCPGLILVECSSHLTVAHLPEPSRQPDGGVVAGGPHISVTGGGGDLSGIVGDNFTDVMLGSTATTTIDLDVTALSSQVLFYLCGKCVGYDSFDMENVKSHMEYDCPGSHNQWGGNAELYLVLRAVLFVVIIIFVFVWLPYLRI